MKSIEQIRQKLRPIKDYPKKGVNFIDIVPLLEDGDAFSSAIDLMLSKIKDHRIDSVVGIESRGFIIGGALANSMGVGFVPIRKEGKLPYSKIKHSYSSEYGSGVLEIHDDSIKKGESVIIVDDVLATGGTAKAAALLVEQLGGNISALVYMVEIEKINGRQSLADYEVISLIKI